MMADKIAIVNAKTGETVIRERTPEEQAAVDAERKTQAEAPPSLAERIAALEEKLAGGNQN